MKYDTPHECESIRLAFNAFLALRGYSFRSFCLNNDLEYHKYYRKIFKGNILDEDINKLIKLADPNFEIGKVDGKIEIVKIN